MLEKVGNKDVYIRDYTNNFSIKEYIQQALIPSAFPNIPMNKLNLGFTGIVSEMISQAIEDSCATASIMMNESFITRAVLPNSIYSAASLFNLGFTFATPSRCNFALQLWLPDVIKYSTPVKQSSSYRYILDKDTKIILGDNIYRLDYDIIIDNQFIDGGRVFNVYYDMQENNSISITSNKYIKHQVTSINWLVLFVELQEFDRKIETNAITDNLITTNSDIELKWSGQIAGADMVYITPQGERLPMKLKTIYTNEEIEPFVWYRFNDDNRMLLSFSSNKGYFTPAFNSKIESTIYTCRGSAANFDSYDNKTGVPVQKTGDRFSYNANTRIVALCYSGSIGGQDKGDIETLRNNVIMAYNTANVLTTNNDLQMWFDQYAKRYNTKAKFFKRRDDPSGRLFSQFIAITDDSYTYPTNTLSIEVSQNQFDYINSNADGINEEFIIKPGHIWEYNDTEDSINRDTLKMVNGLDGPAMIYDSSIPLITDKRPFMFINPFYIKIYKDPTVLANYNSLINHTSWPEDVLVNSQSFYQFQLATLHIERNMSQDSHNKYKISVICIPVVTTDKNMKYIEGIGDDFPIENNNLRLVLITRNKSDGETGYIEMKPIEKRNGGAILFETEISVFDNITADMMIEVDKNKTPGIKSLVTSGPHANRIYIDSQETSLHFACMMKDIAGNLTTTLFENNSYKGYVMANRFANDHRSLSLYRPLSMMRSTITFTGANDNYIVHASLIPFLRYDIALYDDKMSRFIQAFDDQYNAMKPVLERLDGNTSLDIKLYNTYGRSNNYYIGPEDGQDILWNSNILLDNVYVKIKFRMSVYDRSLYSQTVESVINEIKLFFDSLNSGDRVDLHVSDLIHIIIDNQPNVRYIRFLGFNKYDANKQSIFVKYNDISELKPDKLQIYVPEMIRVDNSSIEIIEEV